MEEFTGGPHALSRSMFSFNFKPDVLNYSGAKYVSKVIIKFDISLNGFPLCDV